MSRKVKASTDNSGWVEPKKRKRRKPMTEKQRQAAAKRLEKARAKRAAKNPNYGMSGIHESLRNLADDHPAHPTKVKKWIRTQKELASAAADLYKLESYDCSDYFVNHSITQI